MTDEPKGEKIFFEGVNPDILRATVPRAPGESSRPKEFKKVREDLTEEIVLSRRERVTALHEKHQEKKEPENPQEFSLDQGKQACLRSVVQRLRSGLMNPMEEARAMNFLVENQVVKNQADLALQLDKPKSKISEKLSILKLPRPVQLLIERHPEVITEGHAIELLRLKDEGLIIGVAKRIIEMGLTRDRLRTEIAFLLEKHGGKPVVRLKRSSVSRVRYFPRVDGGFDLIYRFRPEGDFEDLKQMISDMEAKLSYLRQYFQKNKVDQNQSLEEQAEKRSRRTAVSIPVDRDLSPPLDLHAAPEEVLDKTVPSDLTP